MKQYMILNPVAGQGCKALPKGLDAMSKEYEIYITKEKGDCERFIKEIGESGEEARIWVWGGDGTLHEGVNGVYGYSNLSLGIFPVGTGNDYVKNFGNVPAFLDVKSQLKGTEIAVDLMKVNDRVCVNMVNIGLDCHVVVEAAKLKKIPFVSGSGAYIMALLNCFLRAKEEKLTFLVDGETQYSGEFIISTIGKGSFYGGGFQAAPYAKLSDGYMDFGSVGGFTKLALLKLIPSYQKGEYLHKNQGDSKIRHQKIKKISITGNALVSMDGEVVPFTKLDLEVVEKGLRLILPESASVLEKPLPYEALLK